VRLISPTRVFAVLFYPFLAAFNTFFPFAVMFLCSYNLFHLLPTERIQLADVILAKNVWQEVAGVAEGERVDSGAGG
jgi:hypothetical protein